MENRKSNIAAIIGLTCCLPSLIIVSAGLLQGIFGMAGMSAMLDSLFADYHKLKLVIHPVAVLGGLFIVISMNAFNVFKIQFEPQNGTLATTITIRFRLINIGTLALSTFLFCSLLLYAIGENFRIIPK